MKAYFALAKATIIRQKLDFGIFWTWSTKNAHCTIRALYNYAGFCHRRSHIVFSLLHITILQILLFVLWLFYFLACNSTKSSIVAVCLSLILQLLSATCLHNSDREELVTSSAVVFWFTPKVKLQLLMSKQSSHKYRNFIEKHTSYFRHKNY